MALMLSISLFISFVVGVFFGALLIRYFRKRPGSSLQPKELRHFCPPSREYAGLLAAVTVPYTNKFLPEVVSETPLTVVFKHPRPKYPLHYMFVPKKDIKDLGDLSEQDREHLIDLLACLMTTIQKNQLVHYRFWSNGPGYQDVAYLHFHLGAPADIGPPDQKTN